MKFAEDAKNTRPRSMSKAEQRRASPSDWRSRSADSVDEIFTFFMVRIFGKWSGSRARVLRKVEEEDDDEEVVEVAAIQ